MNGKTEEEVRTELQKAGKSEDEISKLVSYKIFAGNRPTNSILLKLIPRGNGLGFKKIQILNLIALLSINY